MSKPSSLPRWATALADPGDIVEPLSGKKDIGWQDAEMPPHSYMNWLFNTVYLWAVYLDGLTGEALTWTAHHIFSNTVAFAAAITGTSATFSSNFSIGGTLTAGATTVSSAHVSGTSALDGNVTAGAAVTAAGTVTGNNVASVVDISSGRDISASRNLTVGDTATVDSLHVVTDATVDGNSDTVGDASAANFKPDTAVDFGAASDVTDPTHDQLVKRSFLKSWGVIRANGTATPTIVASMNVASVGVDVFSHNLRVTYSHALAALGPLTVTVLAPGGPGLAAHLVSYGSLGCEIQVFQTTSGTAVDFANVGASGIEIHYHTAGL